MGLARAAAAILGAELYAGSDLMRSIVSWLTMDDMLLRNMLALLYARRTEHATPREDGPVSPGL